MRLRHPVAIAVSGVILVAALIACANTTGPSAGSDTQPLSQRTTATSGGSDACSELLDDLSAISAELATATAAFATTVSNATQAPDFDATEIATLSRASGSVFGDLAEVLSAVDVSPSDVAASFAAGVASAERAEGTFITFAEAAESGIWTSGDDLLTDVQPAREALLDFGTTFAEVASAANRVDPSLSTCR